MFYFGLFRNYLPTVILVISVLASKLDRNVTEQLYLTFVIDFPQIYYSGVSLNCKVLVG